MKRIFVFVLMLITLFSVATSFASAEEDGEKGERFALLDIDSGASMGNVNYFVLRPVMEYDNREGIAVDTMFDGVIFSVNTPPVNGNDAENIISTLFKNGTCIHAAETVAGEMKEDGFLDKEFLYPIYVTVPYVGAAFGTTEEKEGFCEYYIDTLVSVFNGKNYKNIALVGIYLSVDYDADPTLRAFCVNKAGEKELVSLASTVVNSDIKGAKTFAANKKIKDQLSSNALNGYTLTLNGVPEDENTAPGDDLVSDYNALRYEKIGGADLIFKFRAYNDLYDCASAIENTVPNERAREAYDLVKEIIDCAFDEDFVPVEKPSSQSDWLYYVGAVFALLGSAGILYVVYVFIRKGKSDGK